MNIKQVIKKIQQNKERVIKEIPLHAVIVPILMTDIHGELHLIFQKRSYNITQGGEIAFAGGKVEKTDKTLKSAAKREVMEEMGLSPSQIKIGPKVTRMNHANYSVLDVFLGMTTIQNVEQIHFDIKEVQSVFSMPLSYFMEKLPVFDYLKNKIVARESLPNNTIITYFSALDEIDSDKKGKDSWEMPKSLLLSYKTPYGVIWGITASIIYTIVNLLKNEIDVI